ncbi:opioid growth factor receptor-like protein 1 [Sardina pilchardus]|uniref:opioid growth factor receptor-like protein 1 n=1 Tax=Sardina pilchardus TaxID=27697 RepID=UPI002E10E653
MTRSRENNSRRGMISFRRLVNCVVNILSYFARPLLDWVPLTLNSVMYCGSTSPKGNDYDSESDDFICEYDSTWEDDEDNTNATSKTHRPSLYSWGGRNIRAAKDMQTYRHDYPDQGDPLPCQDFQPNLKFYKNEEKSQPDDLSILDFHNKWKGDYSSLERVHTFIQWLFPIREDGMNFQAYKLTKDEIKAFKEDETAKDRLRISYELMLDFYGIKLVNDKTGDVQRADNWEERFQNLNRYTHNSLRITRILKCLGTLGFEHYQAPLVRFFLKETLENGELPNVKESVLDYFLFSILDKAKRKELIKEAFIMFQHSRGSGKRTNTFTWCPKWVQKKFQEELNRVETGIDSVDETKSAVSSQLEEEKDLGRPDDANLGSQSSEGKLSDKDDETNQKDGEKHQNTEEAGDGMEAKNSISDKQENKGRPDGSSLGSESLPSKHPDKNDETSANKVDGEKHETTEVEGDAQINISDKQTGQSANMPTAKNDSSASGSNQPLPLNTVKLVEDTNQCCTNQDESRVQIEDETSTVLPQNNPDGSTEQGNQGVRTTGSSTEPSKITTAESGNDNLSSDCQRGSNQSSSSIDDSGQVNENIVQTDLNQKNNKDTEEEPVDLSAEMSELRVDESVATRSSTK